jgi:6-phosphofructokinase 1
MIIIGGDGSFEGAKKFTEEYDVPVIGIPKTIDNDISGTDVCIGYDTALNTAMDAIDKLRDTAQSHERIFVVEVMGRDSGFIAYGSGLAGGAEAILVPETKADYINLESILNKGWNRNKSSLIFVVAEGDETGGAYKVADLVRKYMPGKYTGVCVLGHLQRGGKPTAADRILASNFGYNAVTGLLQGKHNVMIGMKKNEICFTPLTEIKKRHLDINDNLLKMLNTLAC